jgi:hypothetical protein
MSEIDLSGLKPGLENTLSIIVSNEQEKGQVLIVVKRMPRFEG